MRHARIRDIERHINWHGLAPATLLIVAAIGSEVNDALAALGRFSFSFCIEFAPLRTNPLEQDRYRFVGRILRNELAPNCYLEHRLTQTAERFGVKLLVSIFKFAIFRNTRHSFFNSCDNSLLLSNTWK